MVSPSNRTRPAVIATDELGDLHALDPAGRCVPRLLVEPRWPGRSRRP